MWLYMKEIGGYLEMEELFGEEYYPDLLRFNLGRTAIKFALNSLGVKKLWLPYFLCDSIISTCNNADIEIMWYHIHSDFSPLMPGKRLKEGEYLFLVNYYGQLSPEKLSGYHERYGNILLDNTHAFFQKPVVNIPTVYSCRKFFGLPDGAYFFPGKQGKKTYDSLPLDSSNERISHILGRYEHSASDYYSSMLKTAHSFYKEPIKKMSRLTKNLLRGINYDNVRQKRNENYTTLEQVLRGQNTLILRNQDGPFVYPYYCPNAIQIRRKLARQKIFIPTYWSNVVAEMPKDSLEYDYAANILPLPCDQRYYREDMEYLLDILKQCI